MPGVWGQDISGSLNQPPRKSSRGSRIVLGCGKTWVGERMAQRPRNKLGRRNQQGLNVGNDGRYVAGTGAR